MGLDMYLRKNTYVGNQYRTKKSEMVKVVLPKRAKRPFPEIKSERINCITEDVAYWRKANQIHNWFVENVQDGNDDCGTYDVSREQLEELLSLVKRVLKDKSLAEKLLPVKEGFFFGSSEYDHYYFSDLKETKKMLTDVLKEDKISDFVYHASW